MSSIGRNTVCPCGSGLKYKRCCALKPRKSSLGSRITLAIVAMILLGGAVFMLVSLDEFTSSDMAGPGRVWSEEHGHWH